MSQGLKATVERVAAPKDDLSNELAAALSATHEDGSPRYSTRDLCLLVVATLLRSKQPIDLQGQSPMLAAAFQELGLPRDATPEELGRALIGQEIDPELLEMLEQLCGDVAPALKARQNAQARAKTLGTAPPKVAAPPPSHGRPRLSVQALEKARNKGPRIFK